MSTAAGLANSFQNEGGQSGTTGVATSSKVGAERDKKRLQLRTSNQEVWQNGPQPPTGSLDSNMKKNTAFVKRIKQSLGAESKDQIVKEVATLNLGKYVEEVIQAIPDGLAKCATSKDCIAAAESISSLHRRFGQESFSLPLSSLLVSNLTMPSRASLQSMASEQKEREETARVGRQKALLRAVAELSLTDLTRDEKSKKAPSEECPSLDWLFGIVRDLLSADREHSNVPVALGLLKAIGSALLGSPRKEGSTLNGEEDPAKKMAELYIEDSHQKLVPAKIQARFRKLFETYFGTLEKRISKEHARLQEQDRKNHEAYIKSGEIFEDRQQNYERMAKNFEKIHDWGKSFSELIGVPLPKLTSEKQSSGAGLAINLDTRSTLIGERSDVEFATGKSAWEDEDTRRFYEDLLELRDMVPPTLLGSTQKTSGEKEITSEPETSVERNDVDTQHLDRSATGSPLVGQAEMLDTVLSEEEGGKPDQQSNKENGEKDTEIGAGPAAQLNAFFAKLPDLTNRALIDSAAVDFAFMNSKAARKRLVKHLGSLPRNRSDLIPYYARLIATLNPYMPDVGQGIVAILDQEFRYLQKKRNVDLAETRAKNVRFLSELTKFKVAPLFTIFHCFKVCLDDFGGANIDNLAIFLESCGRYLLRTEETSERMRSILEMLRRKRAAQNLDHRQLLMLDNAYYQCNPPERTATVQKERSPLELYIRHLIYDVLTRRNLEKVLKLLRKLPWEDSTVRQTLNETFLRSWRIKFSNLHLLALLVHDLQQYHPDFTVFVIDSVLEQIRAGKEANIFKYNQRRVATVKYFGEMYNYRLVNSSLIFDQLWAFVTFGHPGGRPLPGQHSPIDAPDDYFRIRLICTLLDTCGHCFDRGTLRKKLDDYLLFLNLYVLSKQQPVPMDIDFMLADTFEVLRPQFSFKKSFEEAAAEVDTMFAAGRARAGQAEGNEEDEEEEDSSSSSDDNDVEGNHLRRGEEQVGSETESELEEDEQLSSANEEDDHEKGDQVDGQEGEEYEMNRSGDNAVDQDAEEDFNRELAKMMAESTAAPASGASRSKGILEAGLPFIKKTVGSHREHDEAGDLSPDMAHDQHMRFTLLSKKGNRHLTHDVHVPVDAAIAVNSRANEMQQLAERQQLKRLVLGYEGREETDERKALEASLAQKFRLRQGEKKKE